jgi:hypothetical protein
MTHTPPSSIESTVQQAGEQVHPMHSLQEQGPAHDVYTLHAYLNRISSSINLGGLGAIDVGSQVEVRHQLGILTTNILGGCACAKKRTMRKVARSVACTGQRARPIAVQESKCCCVCVHTEQLVQNQTQHLVLQVRIADLAIPPLLNNNPNNSASQVKLIDTSSRDSCARTDEARVAAESRG